MTYKDWTFCRVDDCAKRKGCPRRLTKIDEKVIKQN